MAEAWEADCWLWEAHDIGLPGMGAAWGQGGGLPWLEKRMGHGRGLGITQHRPAGYGSSMGSWGWPAMACEAHGVMAEACWVCKAHRTGPCKHQPGGNHPRVACRGNRRSSRHTLFLNLVTSAASPGHEAPQRHLCRSPPLKPPQHFSFWHLQFTMKMSFRSWL